MQLIGCWSSGFTRRIGITLKLLDLPFDHLNVDVFKRPEDVRPYSPMLKIPALVIDNGEVLLDSDSMVDYLHERVGPLRALIAISGAERRQALRIVGIATTVYEKFRAVEQEASRPEALQMASVSDFYSAQALTGFEMLESVAKGRWLVGGALSQADIMTVVAYQAVSNSPLLAEVNARRFPKLAALSRHAMLLPAFESTVPR
jgi:glutathione S-transferase